MSEEWGPWIEHDGKSCPCFGMRVQVELKDGSILICEPGSQRPLSELNGFWSAWVFARPRPAWAIAGEVLRYRIRKPRGLTILEEVANGVREPVDA